MKKCPRCDHWHHSNASDICDQCWEDMGQMSFWQDENTTGTDLGPASDSDEYMPDIDTVFDREEEARGYQ